VRDLRFVSTGRVPFMTGSSFHYDRRGGTAKGGQISGGARKAKINSKGSLSLSSYYDWLG